jgi:hypothetical protein
MSSQDAIAGSDELKSRSTGSNPFISAFTFDHTGSLKDRLLTAAIVLGVAVVLTFLALTIPHGRIIAVAWAGAVAILSCFEVVRIFARDSVTLAYRKGWGAVHFVALALPSIVATVVGVRGVVLGDLNWKLLYVAVVASAQLLMILHVFAGRRSLDDGSRHGESYAPAFILVGICAPQLIVISSLPIGVHLIWWLVAVVALNDAGAYFAGKYLGKNKISEQNDRGKRCRVCYRHRCRSSSRARHSRWAAQQRCARLRFVSPRDLSPSCRSLQIVPQTVAWS